MICPLGKIAGKALACDRTECGIWDNKKEQCSIVSYTQAYFGMSLATLKMIDIENKLTENVG